VSLAKTTQTTISNLLFSQSRLDVMEQNRSKTSDSERRIGIASIALLFYQLELSYAIEEAYD